MIIASILSAILWLIIGVVCGIILAGFVMGSWMATDEEGFDKWLDEQKRKLNSKM